MKKIFVLHISKRFFIIIIIIILSVYPGCKVPRMKALQPSQVGTIYILSSIFFNIFAFFIIIVYYFINPFGGTF